MSPDTFCTRLAARTSAAGANAGHYGTDRGLQLCGSAEVGQVVGALEQKDGTDAGFAEHIAVEPLDRIGPILRQAHRAVDGVAGEPFVDDRERHSRCLKPQRQLIGPAIVAIESRAHTIAQRVAQHHDGTRVTGRQYVDPFEYGHRAVQAGKGLASIVPGRITRVVGGDIVGLESLGMNRRPERRTGQVEAHGNVGPGDARQRQGIADDLGPRRDDGRAGAIESHGQHAARHQASAFVAQRHAGGADGQGGHAQGVGEADTRRTAAERGAGDQAKTALDARGVHARFDVQVVAGGKRGGGCRTPARYPLACGLRPLDGRR